MDEPIRHVEFNCSTGEELWRDATDVERAASLARQKAHAERTGAEHAQRQADLQLLQAKAAVDPAFAALARLSGVPLAVVVASP